MSSPQRASPAPASRSWLERLWSSIADRARPSAGAAIPPQQRAKVLAEALLSERGEASGAAVARELHSAVVALSPDDRVDFYRFVATHFTPDPARLRKSAEAYLADPTPDHAADLADAAEPPRQELLRRMNSSPGATASLVAARKEILGHLKANPELRALDTDLHHLLASWFNRGFLEIRRIDWQTPAAVLEKLIAYEAVHEITGWDDLRRRLAPDRRCFGFFHPALPGEPLIFVEVALVEGLASAVQPLLEGSFDEAAARQRERKADTAIFYSISNCQDGLRGVSFGNFLIKQVVEELKVELPRLRAFSTLSPVPGFRRWLERHLGDEAGTVIDPADREVLTAALATDDWWMQPDTANGLRDRLLHLCAIYLTAPGDRKGADPVARFHLGNGARLERVNWAGNTAPRGIRESYGIMVNYLYDPDAIEANHEAYIRDGTVARSPEVEALLAKPAPSKNPAKRKG